MCAGAVLRVFAKAGVLALACWMAAVNAASAKTPGGVHCYGKTCHRVSTLEEMDGIVGRTGFLKVSFYDDCRVDRFNACGLTSSGAVFRPDLPDNAASPIFPDGTVLLAFNPKNKRAAVLRVNSAGPYWGDRKLDVSRAAAEKLGFKKQGVAELMVAILKSPDPHEARYKKMRQYDRVPGYIGEFADFQSAHGAAISALALELQAVPVRVAAAGAPVTASLKPVPRPSKAELFQHAINYMDAVTPQVADTVSVAAPIDTARPLEIELDSGKGREALLPVEVPASPRQTLAAYEPDYSWNGLKQRFSVFVIESVHRARAQSPPPSLPPREEWSDKLARFVSRARQQARVGVARRGGLHDLFAELREKAQPQRRFAR
jgi:rare lipoprotein A